MTYRLDLDAENIIDEWILMVDGGHYTFQELYDYYATLDENGDGNPTWTDQVEANMALFEFQIMSGTRDEEFAQGSFRQNQLRTSVQYRFRQKIRLSVSSQIGRPHRASQQ